MSKRVTRRWFIGGGSVIVAAGLVAVAGEAVNLGWLPGRSTMYRELGWDGSAGQIPNTTPGPMISGSFVSKDRLGLTCGWAASYPPGSTPGQALPVLLVLHGYGDSHKNAFGKTGLGLDYFLAAAVKAGSKPFVVASVDGGNSYWHRRASGEDSAAMLINEFLPLLATKGLATGRVGLMGWSMGGYGALRIAETLGRDRAAVAIAESPALWHTFAQAAHGAFDSAADFAANQLYGRQNELDGIPVMVDCGTGDGFYSNARAYVSGFATKPAGEFTAGGHDNAYWRRVAPSQLSFAASHLST